MIVSFQLSSLVLVVESHARLRLTAECAEMASILIRCPPLILRALGDLCGLKLIFYIQDVEIDREIYALFRSDWFKPFCSSEKSRNFKISFGSFNKNDDDFATCDSVVNVRGFYHEPSIWRAAEIFGYIP